MLNNSQLKLKFEISNNEEYEIDNVQNSTIYVIKLNSKASTKALQSNFMKKLFKKKILKSLHQLFSIFKNLILFIINIILKN